LNDQDVGGTSDEDQPDKIKKILCSVDGHDEILFDNIKIFFEKYLTKIFFKKSQKTLEKICHCQRFLLTFLFKLLVCLIVL
jgi:hypothetical protein